MKMGQFKTSNSQKWVVAYSFILRQWQKACFFALSFSV